MLNRKSSPNMGLWNGVGGKRNPDELPRTCVLREVFEETEISLSHVHFKGIVTWSVNAVHQGGMYVYVAALPDSVKYTTPMEMEEGLLAWHDLDWILHQNNAGITPNIPYFLPKVLNENRCYEHHCVFEKGRLMRVKSKPYEESEWKPEIEMGFAE